MQERFLIETSSMWTMRRKQTLTSQQNRLSPSLYWRCTAASLYESLLSGFGVRCTMGAKNDDLAVFCCVLTFLIYHCYGNKGPKIILRTRPNDKTNLWRTPQGLIGRRDDGPEIWEFCNHQLAVGQLSLSSACWPRSGPWVRPGRPPHLPSQENVQSTYLLYRGRLYLQRSIRRVIALRCKRHSFVVNKRAYISLLMDRSVSSNTILIIDLDCFHSGLLDAV